AIYPFHLEQNPARPHHGCPAFRAAFAFSHSSFCRFFCKRLVGKDPDPDAAATLDMARQSNSRSFESPCINPRGLKTFQSEIAKGQFQPSRLCTSYAAFLNLAVFNFLWR